MQPSDSASYQSGSPATRDGSTTTRFATIVRVIFGACGLIALAILLPHVQLANPIPLLCFLGILTIAPGALSATLGPGRTVAVSSAFVFIAFLAYGAATATVLHVGAALTATAVRRVWPRHIPPQSSPIWLRLARIALVGLISGLSVWLVYNVPLGSPPTTFVPLLLYAVVYLMANVALALLLGAVRSGWSQAGTELWPSAIRWITYSVGLSVVIALLAVVWRSNLGFTVDVLLTFAFLAMIGYSVRLNMRLNQANRDLRALNEISQSLAASLNTHDLLRSIYVNVQQVMPVDVFLIGIVNNDQTEIMLPYVVEENEVITPQAFPFEGSLSAQVIRSQQPVLITQLDLSTSQHRFGRADKHSVALLLVPLRLGDRVLGVLSAQSYAPDVYTQHHLDLLAAIGRMAAIAINNAQLFAREKEITRGREEFISLVAHELKNPLAALLGHIQLLQRRSQDSDDRIKRTVAVVSEQGERMNRLVEDLLDLSRTDTGRLTLHLQPVDLRSLVSHVVEQQRVLTTSHTLAIESDDRLPTIKGDVMRLTQVLQNLLSNAIKYSPNGGTVTIQLQQWATDDERWPSRFGRALQTSPCWMVVRVVDQGIGVPPDQLGRIFERFFRANNTAQLDVSGSGLGLSVCEGLVRSHGGVIWAESEWGEGSTFSFALPASG